MRGGERAGGDPRLGGAAHQRGGGGGGGHRPDRDGGPGEPQQDFVMEEEGDNDGEAEEDDRLELLPPEDGCGGDPPALHGHGHLVPGDRPRDHGGHPVPDT